MSLKKTLIISLMLLSLIIPAVAVNAADSSGQPGPYLGIEYGRETGLATGDVRTIAARIINTALGLLGTVAVCLIVYAGFMYLTSGGNEEKTKGALKIIYAAVIGLTIILSAYAISKFVSTQLFKATTGKDYSSAVQNDSTE